MFRYADRIMAIGVCVVALSLVVLALLLQQGRRHGERDEWDAQERGAIAMGSVRDAPVAPAQTRSVAAEAAIAADPADAADEKVERDDAAPAPSKQLAKPMERRVIERRHAAAAKTAQPVQPAQPTKETKHQTINAMEDTPDEYADFRFSFNEKAKVEEPKAQVSAEKTLPPPVQTVTPQPPREASATPPPVSAATTAPKTRAEVREELKRARMNGSLPRFGNPDPYGPGGSPSTDTY